MRILARYPSTCYECGVRLGPGIPVRWNADTRVTRCGGRCKRAAVLAHREHVIDALVSAAATAFHDREDRQLDEFTRTVLRGQYRRWLGFGPRDEPQSHDRERDRERSTAAEARHRQRNAAAGLSIGGLRQEAR